MITHKVKMAILIHPVVMMSKKARLIKAMFLKVNSNYNFKIFFKK